MDTATQNASLRCWWFGGHSFTLWHLASSSCESRRGTIIDASIPARHCTVVSGATWWNMRRPAAVRPLSRTTLPFYVRPELARLRLPVESSQ